MRISLYFKILCENLEKFANSIRLRENSFLEFRIGYSSVTRDTSYVLTYLWFLGICHDEPETSRSI